MIVCYLDFLGSRYWPRVDPENYRRRLGEFRRVVLDKASLLSSKTSVFFLNDCAYIESPKTESLLRYLQEVRLDLFDNKVFVKGAVLNGTLNASDLSINVSGGKINGFHFAGESIKLYALADQLKGVGYWVDQDLADTQSLRGMTTETCYVVIENNTRFVSFTDVAYPSAQLTSSRFGDGLIELLRIHSEDSSASRYFVTHVVSAIRSLDWLVAGEDPEHEHTKILSQILDSRFVADTSDVPGIDAVFGSVLDCAVARAGVQANVTKMIFRRLGKMRRIGRRLAKLPEKILAADSKRPFIDELTRYVKPSQQEEV